MIPELGRSVGGTENSWVNWSIVSGGKNGSGWVQKGGGGTFGLGSCSPLEDLRCMSYIEEEPLVVCLFVFSRWE